MSGKTLTSIVGRLGKDPVPGQANDKDTAKFSVVQDITSPVRDDSGNWQQDSEWTEVTAWEEMAAPVLDGLYKGATVVVQGVLTVKPGRDGGKEFRDMNARKVGKVSWLEKTQREPSKAQRDAFAPESAPAEKFSF